MCLLVFEAASDGHRGDWVCHLDQEEKGEVENIEGEDLDGEGFGIMKLEQPIKLTKIQKKL